MHVKALFFLGLENATHGVFAHRYSVSLQIVFLKIGNGLRMWKKFFFLALIL